MFERKEDSEESKVWVPSNISRCSLENQTKSGMCAPEYTYIYNSLCWPFQLGCFVTAWRYVLGHYLAVGWTPDQRGVYQRVLHGSAKCFGHAFGLRCYSLILSLCIQQKSPRPSRFHLHVWQVPPPSLHLLVTVQKPCVLNRRFSQFDSSVKTFFQSSDGPQVNPVSDTSLFPCNVHMLIYAVICMCGVFFLLTSLLGVWQYFFLLFVLIYC